jgi:hypothetical protein
MNYLIYLPMKPFRNYIIHNCNCKALDYKDYILVYISYLLFYEIIDIINLDEIRILKNELLL